MNRIVMRHEIYLEHVCHNSVLDVGDVSSNRFDAVDALTSSTTYKHSHGS